MILPNTLRNTSPNFAFCFDTSFGLGSGLGGLDIELGFENYLICLSICLAQKSSVILHTQSLSSQLALRQ